MCELVDYILCAVQFMYLDNSKKMLLLACHKPYRPLDSRTMYGSVVW